MHHSRCQMVIRAGRPSRHRPHSGASARLGPAPSLDRSRRWNLRCRDADPQRFASRRETVVDTVPVERCAGSRGVPDRWRPVGRRRARGVVEGACDVAWRVAASSRRHVRLSCPLPSSATAAIGLSALGRVLWRERDPARVLAAVLLRCGCTVDFAEPVPALGSSLLCRWHGTTRVDARTDPS